MKKPKGRLLKNYNERYDAYVHWDFFGWSSFLKTPIGDWIFKPRILWSKHERGFFWLWFHFRWSKTYRYVQRPEWITAQIQKKLNMVTNMQIDNIKMGQKGPPGGYGV